MNEYENFDSAEYLYLTNLLKIYSPIFYKFWLIGKPVYIDDIKTAAISFDKNGNTINFLLNKDFWEKLTEIQKCFIICHECLHIFWNHGKRYVKGNDHEKANIAMDIPINHACVDRFGFSRADIDPENIFCWIDTVFSHIDHEKLIEKNQNFEYYFQKIEEYNVSQHYSTSIVDDHSNLESDMDINFNDILDENDISDLNRVCEEIGSSSHKWSMDMDISNIQKKKKWETVIKKWTKKSLTFSDTEVTRWDMDSRRFNLLSNDLLIPAEMELEDNNKDKRKIDMWFFQDTSGSCVHLAKRFFAAAKSIPTDRFNIRMFCFDTKVYETSLSTGKLYGFGGTTFCCIENKINYLIKTENVKYPDSVWVITDGYGNQVRPAHADRWHWFLNTNYTSFIPKESSIHKLSNYE